MTYTLQLTPDQTAQVLSQAQQQATAISSAGSSTTVGSNTFVFFAAFDGTNNGADPQADGSGGTQNTAVAQLESQVAKLNNTSAGSVQARYYPGVGTPPTLPGSSGYNPNALNAQIVDTVRQAYNDFAQQAYLWLYGDGTSNHPAHSGGSITSMITSFSRGGASAAVFAQMLYENGLVYTFKDNNGVKQSVTLIPPGQTGANSPISAALILDPVETEVSGNRDFPPNVQNFAVVQAENEYRTLFKAADYSNNGATVYQVPGNHGDVGDVYDNGLGGIYLGAYTSFFQNAGLNIAPVDASRAYASGNPILIHSENAALPLYDSLSYNTGPNDITTARQTVSVGTPIGTSPNGQGTEFVTQSGDIVLGGTGGSTTQGGSVSNAHGVTTNTIQNFAVLPDAQTTVTSYDDAITVNDGATLNFNSTSQIGNSNAVQGATNMVTLGNDTTLNISGLNTVVNVDAPNDVTINGAMNVPTKYTVHLADSIQNDLNFDPVSTTFHTDASGDIVFAAPSPGGTQETITVSNTSDNDTVSAGGVSTTISNLGYVSYDASGNIVLNQDSDTASAGSDSKTITSTVGGVTTTETLNAARENQMTTDSLTFEGQSIAGNVGASGETDQYGRTYTLSQGTLTITGATSGDTMTISNFQNGDFGVSMYNAAPVAVDVPGALATTATGMNSAGQIAGDVTFRTNGQFVREFFVDTNGSYADISVPNALFARQASINDSGEVAGTYISSVDFNAHGFTSANGAVALVDVPDAAATEVYGLSRNGAVAGSYEDGSGNFHGFLYSGGTYATLDVPGAHQTTVYGVNDNGEAVGSYVDSSNAMHGFIYANGAFTTLDVPQPFSPDSGIVSGTTLTGINGAGQITGSFTSTVSDGNGDSTTAQHAFLYANGTFTLLGANIIETGGITDSGEILEGDGSNSFLASAPQVLEETNQSLAVGDGASSHIYGNGNTITAGKNDTLTAQGNSNTVTAGTGSSVLVDGSSNTVNAADGDTVTVTGNGQVAVGLNTVTMSNGTVQGDDAASFAVSGTSNTITAGADDNITVSGAGNSIMAAAGDNLTLSGSNVVTASASDIADSIAFDGQAIAAAVALGAGNSSGAYTLNGSTLTVAEGSDALTISNFQNGDFGVDISYNLTLTGGTETVLDSSSVSVTGNNDIVTGGSNDAITVSGNTNTITAGAGSTVSVSGSGDTVTVANGDTVDVSGNGQATDPSLVDTVNVSNGTIHVADNASVAINGDGNTVIDANDNITLTGNNNTLTAGSNDNVSVIGNGTVIQAASGADLATAALSFDGNAVSGSVTTTGADTYSRTYALSGGNLTITDGSNTLTLDDFTNGDFGLTVSTATVYNETNSTLNLGDHADAIVNGDGNFITAGVNSTVVENGSWGWVTEGSNSSMTATGDGNTLTAANGDTVTLAGQYDAVHMNNGTVHVSAASDFNLDGSGNTVTSASNVSIAVLGDNNTLSLSGGSTLLTIGGTGNAANLSGSGMTVAGAATEMTGSVENITFSSGMMNINAGDSAVITGTDGVMTASNAVGGGGSTNTIDWNVGGSQVQTFSGLAAGVSEEVQNYTGANGTGTLTSTTLYGTSGNDTLAATGANQTLVGNGGYDTYQFGRGDGQNSIVNGLANTGPSGELDLGAGIATNQIWFERSGNNLLVDIIGSQDSMTVAGWYGSDTSAQFSEIKTADGYMIDTQLAQLVQAMATFATDNPGFNPTTATAMPTDPALQSTLAAAWHHS